MKFVETKITFSEVPDEISLCINISGCPLRCPGCHSPWLQEGEGTELTEKALLELIDQNPGITCVCLMGGQESEIGYVLPLIKARKLKAAWYTGQSTLPKPEVLGNLDFIKVGPYISEKGPLSSKTTNQVFYRVEHTDITGTDFFGGEIKKPHAILYDDTSKFWK